MSRAKPLYHRRRFPGGIISHCVWLYFRFCLSYRDVEEIMAKRGVAVTYETIRDWSQTFGGTYAKRLRSRAPRPGDRWHLDEVYLSINGKLQYLWRAVDQDGEVLDILVQPRRNRRATKKFFRKLLRGLQYVPRVIITDKLGSYAAARAEVLPDVLHIHRKRANNRAESSHQPARERERRMRGFKSPGHAQRFLATFGVIASSGSTFARSSELSGSYASALRRMGGSDSSELPRSIILLPPRTRIAESPNDSLFRLNLTKPPEGNWPPQRQLRRAPEPPR